MLSPFSMHDKESSKFKSLNIWKQLKTAGNDLSWYFAVSTNHMPAKYLISKSIFCNITDLATVTEERLWEEHRNLTEIFLESWNEVRSEKYSVICSPSNSTKSSLMDLNIELTKRMLKHCNFCRWDCQIDRSDPSVGAESKGVTKQKKHGTCQLESTSKVSSYFHHRGEELVFRGAMGSGTIFFTSCNMRCSFCQNGDISTDKDNGVPITPELLAFMIWQLRMEGCHNTNWVGGDPTIHLHTIVEAIGLLDSLQLSSIDKMKQYHKYVESANADNYHIDSLNIWLKNSESAFYQRRLFNSPQLWNSNFFMSGETMHILRTLIDVWLPDFKFGPGKCALDISRTPWYWETVTKNLKLIHEWGEDFVIRHLIMPSHVQCCTKPVLDWIATNMPDVPINIMDQYYPDNLCDPTSPKFRERYNEIARSPTIEEIISSYQYAKELNLNFEALSYEKSIYGINL